MPGIMAGFTILGHFITYTYVPGNLNVDDVDTYIGIPVVGNARPPRSCLNATGIKGEIFNGGTCIYPIE